MRWINGATLFLCGLLYVLAGYAEFGNRYSGAALLMGTFMILFASGVVVRGEINPYKKLPKIAANSWAAICWYSAIVIVAMKYETLATGGTTLNAPHKVSNAVLVIYMLHAVLLGLCPFCYLWSQFYLGRKR